jgi:hypothetical protein
MSLVGELMRNSWQKTPERKANVLPAGRNNRKMHRVVDEFKLFG